MRRSIISKTMTRYLKVIIEIPILNPVEGYSPGAAWLSLRFVNDWDTQAKGIKLFPQRIRSDQGNVPPILCLCKNKIKALLSCWKTKLTLSTIEWFYPLILCQRIEVVLAVPLSFFKQTIIFTNIFQKMK